MRLNEWKTPTKVNSGGGQAVGRVHAGLSLILGPGNIEIPTVYNTGFILAKLEILLDLT